MVHGILQAKMLEWVTMPSSKGSSQSRDLTCISYDSCIGRHVFTTGATWEAHSMSVYKYFNSVRSLQWGGKGCKEGMREVPFNDELIVGGGRLQCNELHEKDIPRVLWEHIAWGCQVYFPREARAPVCLGRRVGIS